MKNTIITVFIIAFFVNAIQAQNQRYGGAKPAASKAKVKPLSPFYVKLSAGYSFLTPGSYRGYVQGLIDLIGGTLAAGSSVEVKNPFGSGIRASFGLGYNINDNLSVGIDAEGLFGPALTERQINTARGIDVTNEHTIRIVTVVPHIVFKTISTEGFFLYNRVGVVVGIPYSYELLEKGKGEITLVNGGPLVLGDIFRRSEIKNIPGWGFMATLGANFKVTRHLSAYTELYSSQFTTKPDNIERKVFTFNGTPRTLSASDYEPRLFVNSIGLSAGMMYRF
jgi:hypothetical protein